MKRFRHTLVVGGTGMLRVASEELARRSEGLTSIARTDRSLAALDRRIADTECRHHAISQDYNDLSGLRAAVRSASELAGPIDLVVAWIHDENGPVPVAICELVSNAGSVCHFAHVMGSAAGDPTSSLEARSAALSAYPDLTYQAIILGFRVESAEGPSRSRWLNNDEISAGVVEAIEAGESPFIVGQVEPWSMRP